MRYPLLRRVEVVYVVPGGVIILVTTNIVRPAGGQHKQILVPVIGRECRIVELRRPPLLILGMLL